jgi:prephenate dehydrogenase
MGGSLALACKHAGLGRSLTGVTRRLETAEQALAIGAVDRATTDLVAGLRDADIVVLAAPVRTVLRQLHQLRGLPLSRCVLFDLGSTKRAIVQAMAGLPPTVQPVGCHPMCGKETSGLAAADPTLYQGAVWVITPTSRTTPVALGLASEIATGVGAHPLVLDAERHDRLVAAISHLPYLLATALVLATAELGTEDEMVWQLAASGFRDTSRLAASDVDMMLDILLTNRAAIGEALQRVSAQLARLGDRLAHADEPALRDLLGAARRAKCQMTKAN